MILAAAFGIDSADDESAAFTTVATLAQNVIFIGTAVLFASMTARPRAWHFGLNRTRVLAGGRLGGARDLLVLLLRRRSTRLLVQPDAEQGITEALGADEGTIGLISAGLHGHGGGAGGEEVFFRGFFYRALRSRFSVARRRPDRRRCCSALIHWDFERDEGSRSCPPLALLGFMFCLVYERTGSLFPVIALHAINNAIAYGVQTDGDRAPAVSVGVGVAMLAGCVVVPRLLRPAPAAS